MSTKALHADYLRTQIVGVDSTFETPFGERLMSYCDYTASGRCLKFVESYLQSLQRIYANTHTEDDITGRSMSQLLHEAEESIKESVNAGPDGRIIACGTGATGAIDKLQQIVGVAMAPATRKNVCEMLAESKSLNVNCADIEQVFSKLQPVVFIGPYEHHSNEISWRESLATTVTVHLDANGSIDLSHLDDLLHKPEYQNRLRIGSFSAASNVTGIRSDIRGIASLLHANDALACFDFAACAPYVDIDMNPHAEDGTDASIDAIFVSPHKFLGGPGSSGVLVFNQRIYHRELPPSVSAGGTVDYVGRHQQDFMNRIEDREKAGTPGVLQTLKAAMVFQIKDRVGIPFITQREHELTKRTMDAWAGSDNIVIMGNPDPAQRVGIISFNVRCESGRYLHHKFVTALLNDLFGIQSRAGCSCAGPYGHRLLDIDHITSERYRKLVQSGYCGMKPGWCRVGLHWVMDDAEADHVINAILFIASHGHHFLELYDFDLSSGTWTHKQATGALQTFSLDAALADNDNEHTALSVAARKQLYDRYLNEAMQWAERLSAASSAAQEKLDGELGDLQFFALPACCTPQH